MTKNYTKKELAKEKLEKVINTPTQSVRHLIHDGEMYAVYITKGFKQMGWLGEVNGKYYGTITKLALKEKDDIIDYYLTLDKNAKDTIEAIKNSLA
jgi:hypothetical protein